MENNHELTDLRDTLAIEITRVLLEKMPDTPKYPGQIEKELLPRVYGMADAVLSHRNVSAPRITKRLEGSDGEARFVGPIQSGLPHCVSCWKKDNSEHISLAAKMVRRLSRSRRSVPMLTRAIKTR